MKQDENEERQAERVPIDFGFGSQLPGSVVGRERSGRIDGELMRLVQSGWVGHSKIGFQTRILEEHVAQ